MAVSIAAERFLDVGDELDQALPAPALKDFAQVPLVSLKEAVQPIKSLLSNVDSMVSRAIRDSRPPADGLTIDESAAIRLYTMSWPKAHRSLSILLNERLRSEDRNSLVSWFLFLKLFFTALYKLPTFTGTVWRSARGNLSDRCGKDHIWWGISSCTGQIHRAEAFVGSGGPRTILTLHCASGKAIHAHSSQEDQKEILLLPGSSFRLLRKWKAGKDLFMIDLQETTLPSDLPFSSVEKSTLKTTGAANKITSMKSHEQTKKWKQNGVNILSGKNEDQSTDQVCYPEGICIDDGNSLYFTDCENHRALQWKCQTNELEVIAGGNEEGNQENQLSYPTDIIIDKRDQSLLIADLGNRRVVRWFCHDRTKQAIVIADIDCTGLAMDKHALIYVCDHVKHEVRRWKEGDQSGVLVAGGHGQGSQLNQLDAPTFIFVYDKESIYISDSANHRVMKWTKDARKGVVVAGGHGKGSSLRQLFFPQGVIVDHLGHIYVVDHGNHRVIRWSEGGKHGALVVGGNGQGKGENQLNGPFGMSFDGERNLYVADFGNHRVQKYDIDFA